MARWTRCLACLLALVLPVTGWPQNWGLQITESASGDSVEVTALTENSPAHRAGLRAGDRIISVQGRATGTPMAFGAVVQSLPAGTALQLRVVRDGWERSFSLEPQSARGSGWLGITLEMAPAQPGQGGHPLRVSAISEASPAARAGLAIGDLILATNGREPDSVAAFERALAGFREGEPVTLTVSRDGWQRQIAIREARGPGDGPASAVSAPARAASSDAPPGAPSNTASEALYALAVSADQHYMRGDWPAAAQAYREYLQAVPAEARAWDRLGHALLMMDRHRDAVEALNRSMIAGPPTGSALNNLGMSLSRLGDLDGARNAYSRAIEVSPDLLSARQGLAGIHMAQRNWEAAREQLQIIVAREPGNAEFSESLAGVFMALGRPADAVNEYRRAIGTGHPGPDAHYGLAYALFQADKPTESLAEVRALLTVRPGEARAQLLHDQVQAKIAAGHTARLEVPTAPQELARQPADRGPLLAAGAGAGAPSGAPAGPPPPAPAATQAAGTGDKATVAVGDFQVKASGASQMIGDGLREMLVTALHGSGRFIVMERLDLAGLAAEQQLSRSRMARADASLPGGQMEVAEIMVYGAVTEFLLDSRGGALEIGVPKLPFSIGRQTSKAHLAIDVRVVDVTSGRILGAQRIVGEADSSQLSLGVTATARGTAIPVGLSTYKNTPMEQAIRTCLEQSIAYVTQAVPTTYFRHR